MAGPPCMSEDGRPAVFVGTMLQTGDAVALCDECLVPWCAAILNAMTGVDPTPFLQAISDTPAVPTAAQGAPTDEPPAPGPADVDGDADRDPKRAGSDEPEDAAAMPAASNGYPVGRTQRRRGSAQAVTGGGSQGADGE